MFIEVTSKVDGFRKLLNDSAIRGVSEDGTEGCTVIIEGETDRLKLNESFDEVKKRLGGAISPRAETLMKGIS